jgi:hypothetical protein
MDALNLERQSNRSMIRREGDGAVEIGRDMSQRERTFIFATSFVGAALAALILLWTYDPAAWRQATGLGAPSVQGGQIVAIVFAVMAISAQVRARRGKPVVRFEWRRGMMALCRSNGRERRQIREWPLADIRDIRPRMQQRNDDRSVVGRDYW